MFCTYLSIIVKHSTRSTEQPYGNKLIACGISGKVLRVILNMYKSIKSCGMSNVMQSEFFESHVGLSQGENLSPTLFVLFLKTWKHFHRAEMEYAEVYTGS